MGIRLTTVAATLLLIICGAFAQAIGSRDAKVIGLYGFNKQSESGPVPLQYGLVVIHVQAFDSDLTEELEAVREQAAAGRQVLVDFQFMSTRDQRRALEPLPPLEQTKEALFSVLDRLEGVELVGVTLDEENRTRPERMAYLAELYEQTKAAYPDRMIFQWLSLGAKQTLWRWNPETFPADGYVIDPYLADDQGYRDIVAWVSRARKPIYSVVWVSPGWEVGAGRRKRADTSWWNDTEWKVFYNRLATNDEFGVNTIFYTYALVHRLPAALSRGSYCERQFEAALLETTIPWIQNSSIEPRTPALRPDWIPAYCQN